MRKIQALLVFAFLLLGKHASAQFHCSSYMPCEGDTVIVSLMSNEYSGVCDANPNLFTPTNQYLFQIFYPGGGSYTIISGTVGFFTTNTTLKIKPNPISYTNPGQMEIRVTRYKTEIATNQMVQCTQQSFFIQPKKKVVFSGNTELVDMAIQNYSVTNVPGVNFTWDLPASWAVVSSNSNNSSIQVSPSTTGYATISVTANPDLIACGWPISRMITISPCYFNGTTDFEYCEIEENWGDNLLSNDYGDAAKFPRMMGDFTGDGKSDVIGFGNNAVVVGASTGSSFNYSSWTTGFTYGNAGYTETQFPRRIGDFNGDGKDDVIGFGQSQTVVGLSNGSSFSTSGFSATSAFTSSQGYTAANHPRMIGDFNGDGKDDVIGFGHAAVAVGLSNGSSFNTTLWTGGTTFSTGTGGFGDENKFPRMVGDFNGDGKTDVIGFGNTSVAVGLSTGSSFNVSTWTTSFTYGTDNVTQSHTPRGIGDFNGDGKDDIICFGYTTVAVGLSTGSGFTVSDWTDQDFTHETGWEDIQLSSLGSRQKVLIADMNGDGKDDLVGFAGSGTFIAYSTGSKFMCSAHGSVLSFENQVAVNEARFVGNFDNTDDQLELVAFDDEEVLVLDCNTCATPVASATLTGHYAMVPETVGQNTLNVYRFCTNTIGLDLTGTSCEDRYFVEIKEFNIGTWTSGATVYQSNWIHQKAPESFDLSSVPNLQPGQLYMVTFGVGPAVNTKSFGIRITGTSAHFTNTPNQTRTYSPNQLMTFTIDQYCNNVLSFNVNGVTSGCYDDYRYEVQEVSTPFMLGTGPFIQQIPAGGGWNSGSIAQHSISMSGIVMGKIYAVRLYVRKNGVTHTFIRYVERNGCTISVPKSAGVDETEWTLESDLVSTLYPNPAADNLAVVPLGYSDEQITGEIYDTYGKLVERITIDTSKENTIDLLRYTPGMYVIMLHGTDRTEKLSFIKQ